MKFPHCEFYSFFSETSQGRGGTTSSSSQIGGTSKEKALPNGLFHIKGDPRILLENQQGQVCTVPQI